VRAPHSENTVLNVTERPTERQWTHGEFNKRKFPKITFGKIPKMRHMFGKIGPGMKIPKLWQIFGKIWLGVKVPKLWRIFGKLASGNPALASNSENTYSNLTEKLTERQWTRRESNPRPTVLHLRSGTLTRKRRNFPLIFFFGKI